VFFTSDNGPVTGSAEPLRGKKGSAYEGGVREPAIMRWPGKIQSGLVNDELLTAMDLLPTFAKLAGAKVPTDRVIDGKDIWPVLVNQAKTPYRAFFYHQQNELKAVRSGKWKLHVEGDKPLALYDLENDISESINVLNENPQIATQLLGYIKEFQEDIKINNRPAAYVENPKPLIKNSN
jgi:arylsulfatase A-like enzyme